MLTRLHRLRCGAKLKKTIALVAAGALTGCGAPLTWQDTHTKPDVMDEVRNQDLLPRFPERTAEADLQGTVRPGRAQLFSAEPVSSMQAIVAPATSTGTGPGYELNFENATIASVAKTVLGDILKTSYTIDPRAQGNINIASGRPVPKQDLLFVFESALRLAGVALVRDGAAYRIVPQTEALAAGSLDSQPANVEPGFGVSVVPLQYISAGTLMQLLDSFATKPGAVRVDKARNMLLVQGTGPERRTVVDTAVGFDVDWMRGQSVGIFPLQNSAPEPVLTELEKILNSKEGDVGHDLVKFQVMERRNAILAVTSKPQLLRTVQTWIGRLDASDPARVVVHVRRVKYGDARQLAKVLGEIFGGGSSNATDSAAGQVAPGSGLVRTSSNADRLPAISTTSSSSTSTKGNTDFGGGALGGGSRTGNDTGGSELQSAGLSGRPVMEGIRIAADVSTNSLLIYANAQNYRTVEQTIRQLDQPQAQVAIDATIAEVTLNNNLSYGVQFFIQSKNLGMAPDRGSALNVPSSPPGQQSSVLNGVASAFLNRAFPGFNFLVGPEAQPNMIIDALHAVTDVKILSNPSLVVIDNQVGTLLVGNEIPVSTGTGNVLNSATGTNNTIINSIDYRNTGIILRVIPRVSPDGNVRLDIEQEISQATNATANSLTPTVSQRKVKSSVAVPNGQTVLLAGLIQENTEVDRGGIPVLDEIPKIGDLLSHQNKTTTRTELIIFIRPQVIRDSIAAHYVAEEFRAKLRGTVESLPSKGRQPPLLQ
ncbi:MULTISPECIES: type II secretion system secretin GspD [Bradyrhizobium]|uniref:Type II secretion system protein GspD n=3 Tax=Bradyrhizobium TaxID=374 RepID=A0AAE6CD22_9BRAD|nr:MULTISPECIES: type II secretion system secretin GspD [Bradyrhizobium]MCG2628160.1 type II secretion system secretin GspD [Bradyrhizobium zhengyangense]MCG2643279.1 type II secretion system secretin GspD [Bradyrhizobium zhengyangense]MCG2670407.1 type II secretion system secretin GspD [Bradyrhizobium zhengyangense]MDN4985858.1 type II secretion system secretin GspD [Bradyrhizobium sp. WYCCWR 13022]MDN5002763.1 type II secretion system secretin GspD [Bradyrhizobium sp. WYCCWR 12677]